MSTSLSLVLFFAAVALIPTGLAIKDWRTWYYLWRSGVLTPVEVSYHWIAPMGLVRYYFVIYEFEYIAEDGYPLRNGRHAQITQEMYESFLFGDPLIVRYSTQRPDIYRLEGESDEKLRWLAGAIFGWLWVLMLAALAL